MMMTNQSGAFFPRLAIAEIVDTAWRDSALRNPEGTRQSLPEGQDKLDVIEADLSAVASCRSKPWRRLMAKEEARETDKALRRILKQLEV